MSIKLDVPLFSSLLGERGFLIPILLLGNSAFGYYLRRSDRSEFALLAQEARKKWNIELNKG